MMADTKPEYMQVGDQEISEAFGPEICARIFSDEFSAFRMAALRQTIPETPEIGITMLDIYPHQLKTGERAWVERYLVKSEHEFGRSIIMFLDGSSMQFAHLVPGRTNTGPELQCHVLAAVFQLLRDEGTVSGWDGIEPDEVLAQRGIPEVWPQACPVSVFDSALTKVPEEAGSDWSERWGFHCGEGADAVILVDIDFSAGPNGSIKIEPRIVEG